MINNKVKLENSFQEIIYLNDNWFNKGSGWIVESIESQYINISIYRKFLCETACRIKKCKKGLSHIKNEDQKCFLWCYVRHINSVKIHPETINKEDERLANYIDYDGIEFPVQEKDFNKIETRKNMCITLFGYENGLTFPIHA